MKGSDNMSAIVEFVLIAVIIFTGSFIQGVSGFGFGLFVMSFVPFFFTLQFSSLLVISLSVITALSIIGKVYKQIQWAQLGYLLAATAAGRFAAFFILHNFGEMDILKKVLGLVLLGMVVYTFAQKPDKKLRPVPKWVPLTLGFCGGLVGGVFGVGGPFFVVYFLLTTANKYHYTANLQITFLIGSLFTVLAHAGAGDYSKELLLYIPIGIVCVLLGTRIGIRYFEKLPQKHIRTLTAVIIGIAGLNMLFFA